jgi:uncharacterized membrane protein
MALSLIVPVAYALEGLMFFSDKPKRSNIDIVSVVGVVASTVGYVLGTFYFHWDGFGGA